MFGNLSDDYSPKQVHPILRATRNPRALYLSPTGVRLRPAERSCSGRCPSRRHGFRAWSNRRTPKRFRQAVRPHSARSSSPVSIPIRYPVRRAVQTRSARRNPRAPFPHIRRSMAPFSTPCSWPAPPNRPRSQTGIGPMESRPSIARFPFLLVRRTPILLRSVICTHAPSPATTTVHRPVLRPN